MSSLTVQNVADYLRLDDATDTLLSGILEAAKNYVLSYTGRTASDLDSYPDIAIAVLVLCQDMYDNRSMYVDKSNANRVVETILGMYRVNFLPSEDDDEDAEEDESEDTEEDESEDTEE